MFFSALESRAGEVVRDAEGKVIRTIQTVRARPPVQYRFQDLHAAFSEYLEAIVAMLEKLSQLEILRREKDKEMLAMERHKRIYIILERGHGIARDQLAPSLLDPDERSEAIPLDLEEPRPAQLYPLFLRAPEVYNVTNRAKQDDNRESVLGVKHLNPFQRTVIRRHELRPDLTLHTQVNYQCQEWHADGQCDSHGTGPLARLNFRDDILDRCQAADSKDQSPVTLFSITSRDHSANTKQLI